MQLNLCSQTDQIAITLTYIKEAQRHNDISAAEALQLKRRVLQQDPCVVAAAVKHYWLIRDKSKVEEETQDMLETWKLLIETETKQ